MIVVAIPSFVVGSALAAWATFAAPSAPAAPCEELGIDPITLLQWREACELVERHGDAIWPGYRLARIPALLMHPGKAEVLLRFPQPPPSYVRFAGAHPLGDEPLFVRRRTTVYSVVTDTTTSINGVQTLVVTDRGARDSINDAWNLCTQVHEGFHAFAATGVKLPDYSELDFADYPDLEPERSARLELEAEALLAALAADAPDEIEEQAFLFLAERCARRAGLSSAIVHAEDANEMNEGLATYVEWRALELWRDEGVSQALRAANPELATAKAFAAEIEQRTIQLRHLARHTMGVNGSEFGTAVVRRRGYLFGAAIGRLLDRLLPEWKGRAAKGETLTALLHEALGAPGDAELAERAAAAEATAGFPALVAKKATQAERATRDRDAVIAKVLDPDAAGTLLRIDVSALTTGPLSPASYTPFGVVRIDADRRLFWMAPTRFNLGSAALETQDGAVAIITDDARHELLVRVPTAAAEVLQAVTRPAAPAEPAFADAALRLEGHVTAATQDSDGSIVIRLADPRGG